MQVLELGCKVIASLNTCAEKNLSIKSIPVKIRVLSF